jgi:multidrug efflux pump subunit AcrB
VFIIGFMVVVLASFGLTPFLGSNFFPSVDSGQITLHVRAPVGTRLEDASLLFGQVERTIRQNIPADELVSVVDNIGIPNSSINMVYSNSGVIGPQDGDIFVSLKPEHHPTAGLCEDPARGAAPPVPRRDLLVPAGRHHQPDPELRRPRPDRPAGGRPQRRRQPRLRRQDPGAPEDHSRSGRRAHAAAGGAPQLRVDVDRSRIAQLGLTERDVTNSMVTSLAGSSQVSPTFWLNPKNGVSYPIVAQVPEYRVNALSGLEACRSRRGRRPRAPRSSAAWARSAATALRPWSATTTSSRCSTSTPRRKAATWAR